MREKTLRTVAVICFMLGMVMLFMVSRSIELESEPVKIGSITAGELNSRVRVCGNASNKFVSKDGHVFMRVRDETGSIKVVMFSDDVENLKRYGIDVRGIFGRDEICVRGEVSEWDREIEIIADWLEV